MSERRVLAVDLSPEATAAAVELGRAFDMHPRDLIQMLLLHLHHLMRSEQRPENDRRVVPIAQARRRRRLARVRR
jgi:hypothetical protein